MKKGFLGILVLLCCGLGQVPAHAAILINEILADPAADANGDGALSTTKDEFIELLNTGKDPVDLGGWTLSDAVSVRHTFSASTSIPGYGFYVIFGGGTSQGLSASASTGTLSLNNAGDTVTFRNAGGDLMDQAVYGPEGGSNVSLTRLTDGQGAFVKHNTLSDLAFSPGKTVTGLLELPHETEVPPQAPQEEKPGSLPEEPVIPPVPSLPDVVVDPVLPPLPPISDEGGPVVPEPATWMLFTLGASSLIAQRRKSPKPY